MASIQEMENYYYEQDNASLPKTIWERTLGALDYAANISRSVIKGAAEESKDGLFMGLMGGVGYGVQAATKDRYTPTQDISRNLILKKLTGDTTTGSDVGDFLFDLGVDMVTDPLTYLTFGAGKLAGTGAKAAEKGYKLAGKLEKVPMLNRINPLTQVAEMAAGAEKAANSIVQVQKVSKLGALKAIGKPIGYGLKGAKYGIGGLVGASMAPEDADLPELLAYTAMGVGAVGFASNVGGIKRMMSPAKTQRTLEMAHAARTVKTNGGLINLAKDENVLNKFYKKFGKTNGDVMIGQAKTYAERAAKTRGLLGGLYGYAMSDPEDPFVQKLGMAAAGYVALRKGGKVTGYLGEVMKSGNNAMIDSYYKSYFNLEKGAERFRTGFFESLENSDVIAKKALAEQTGQSIDDIAKRVNNPDIFGTAEDLTPIYDNMIGKLRNPVRVEPSYLLNAVSDVKDKMDFITRQTLMGRKSALNGLSKQERLHAELLNRELKNITLHERNKILENIKNPTLEQQNMATLKANEIAKEEAQKLSYIFGENVYKTVEDIAENNMKIVARRNEEILSGTPLVGIRYHVPDMYNAKDFYDFKNVARSFDADYIKLNFASGNYDYMGKLKDPLKIPSYLAYSEPEKYAKIVELNKAAKAEKQMAYEAMRELYKGKKASGGFAEYVGKKVQPIYDDIDSTYRAKARPIADDMKATEAGYEKAYEKYANMMGYIQLDKMERQAFQGAQQLKILKDAALHGGNSITNWSRLLKNFDSYTNFIKTNLLGVSMSWLGTSYFDNIGKAYIEAGLPAAVSTTVNQQKALPKMLGDLAGDMKGIITGKSKFKLTPEEMVDIERFGVVEKNMTMFAETRADNVIDDLIDRGRKLVAERERNPRGVLGHAKSYINKFAELEKKGLEKTMLNMGQELDVQARSITYRHVLKNLVDNGTYDYILKNNNVANKGVDVAKWSMDQVKEMAAKITKDAFFDYRKVSHFEKAVAKRIMPFWTFYARNIPYWAGNLTDIKKLPRVANIERVRRNVGTEPTFDEKAGMPSYLRALPLRSLGRDVYDNTKLLDPTRLNSMYEFMQTNDPIVGKINPLLKNPVELLTQKDSFLGGPLDPKDALSKEDAMYNEYDETAKKYMFDRGRTYYELQQATGVDLGMRKDPSSDQHYSVNGKMPNWNKVIEIVAPFMGGVDKVVKFLTQRDSSLIPYMMKEGLVPARIRLQSPEQKEYFQKIKKIQGN